MCIVHRRIAISHYNLFTFCLRTPRYELCICILHKYKYIVKWFFFFNVYKSTNNKIESKYLFLIITNVRLLYNRSIENWQNIASIMYQLFHIKCNEEGISARGKKIIHRAQYSLVDGRTEHEMDCTHLSNAIISDTSNQI